MLTPLYARAYAPGLLPGSGFRDPLAESLLRRAGGHRAPEVLQGRSDTRGALHRAMAFDAVVGEFTRRHPRATVVSVGVGLCTRNHRLADRTSATVSWVGVDLPEVVALRRRLLPGETMPLVAASLADRDWTRGIPQAVGPVLVLAEGVLMYLAEEELRSFLATTRESFGEGTELLADYFHPRIARSGRHPIVRATGVRFRSGVRDGARLAALGEGWTRVREYPVLERIGLPQRLAAGAFRALALGGRPYAVARLRVDRPVRR